MSGYPQYEPKLIVILSISPLNMQEYALATDGGEDQATQTPPYRVLQKKLQRIS
jgi:hypothetical protein